jgi:hypothetical protein
LETDGTFDPVGLVRDLAVRQIDAAGGPPPPEEQRTPGRSEAEAEVVAMLPASAPEGYGLALAWTVAGDDELQPVEGVQPEVIDFLNENSTTATRAWTDDSGRLIAAVSITRFPYDIFAAAAAAEFAKSDRWQVLSTDAMPDVPDVVGYTGIGDDANEIGTAFRRDDLFVIVLTAHRGDVPPQTAAALAADLTRLVAASHPGDTALYEFPNAPSKALGLALTAALVTAVATGSTVIARVRARQVERGWAAGELRPPDVVDVAPHGVAVALDADASRLRRRGGIIAVAQLVTVNIGIVALAGDFAWPGVIVAAIALVTGVALTHWWQRHELGLLGAAAPPRELVLPRPAGAVVGLLSLALLGFGIAYLLKGLRYLVLKPTLAQMKWSDWLGVAPRTVGVIFVIGGFVVAMVGGWLYRIARALSRAGTERTLQADPRPAALWLRSFDDDSLPLPSIASARRPLFELFSLRGADPFEESVAWELNTYGPVVAVGRPGRSLASLGAAREHLSDETWRDQVTARMGEAGIVAVATGETDGLAWELGQIVAGGHLSKTFFVFPPVPPDALGRRWNHTAASLERAGQAVGALPAPVSLIHTVRLDPDGTANITYARRRDEATYRTAVDRAVTGAPVTDLVRDAAEQQTV